jgi:hypothetical protein
MTSPADLPPGEPFHNFDELGPQTTSSFHAYMATKDLNDGVKFATRLALDRARQGGYNPRKGTVTVSFDDAGVAARWDPKP